MYVILLCFITSFILVLLTTPSLIKVAELKKLYDEPGEDRKLHKISIPSIGGIVIFAAFLFSYSLWFPPQTIGGSNWISADFKYIVATIIILFFIGVKDDIIGTAPVKKLMGHIIVGLILVVMAKIKITSLYGIFGIREIPEWASILLSLFTYIVIVNAYNLIDGVDGLAAGVGFISSVSFGIWFFIAGDLTLTCLAFTLAGALLAFLIFNFSPAKIFMGDSGAITIGLILSILAIKLIEFPTTNLPGNIVKLSKPVFAIAVMIYPLFDTLRIFIYRTSKGISPFAADKKHIHHRILKLGLNQRETVLTIYGINILIILISVSSSNLLTGYQLLIVSSVAIIIAQIPYIINKKKPQVHLAPLEEELL